MRQSVLASALSVVLCVAQSAMAQRPDLPSGARVRVTAPQIAAEPLVGVVARVTADTIYLKGNVEEFRPIALPLVSQLEVSLGRKRPTWSKIAPLWLTAAGVGFGAAVGYATTPEDDFLGREFGAAVFGTLGGTLGLLTGIGLAIGVKSETWEQVAVQRSTSRAWTSPSMFVAPFSGGATLGLRARF